MITYSSFPTIDADALAEVTGGKGANLTKIKTSSTGNSTKLTNNSTKLANNSTAKAGKSPPVNIAALFDRLPKDIFGKLFG
jgi:hypothetical protein